MLASILALGLTAYAAEPQIDALVDNVQRHYDELGGFEARFTQRYQRRLISKVVEESGRIVVKKPGKMRWEYQLPEEKLFVTNGTSSYFYIPLERQVMVSHEPRGAMGLDQGSPFELLAGRARLTDGFTFFASKEEPERGGVMLHLVPTTRQDEFESVEMEVDPDTGAMLRVILIDGGGNRTEFIFEDLRGNNDLPEALFEFTIPSGVDVVLHSDSPAVSR